MEDNDTESGSGSVPDQPPSESQQLAEESEQSPAGIEPVVEKSEEISRNSDAQNSGQVLLSANNESEPGQGENVCTKSETVEAEILSDQGSNKDTPTLDEEIKKTEVRMNNTEAGDLHNNDHDGLNLEVEYNREVLGAETYTSIDDLLHSDKDNLIDKERDIEPKSSGLVEVNIVKIDCTNVDAINRVNSDSESVNSETADTLIEDSNKCDSSSTENGVNESLVSSLQDSLKMPETREETEGSMSPSLMFAVCRYRWEKTIVTQSDSVVFVTINNKEIEPIKLVWAESSKCFYSDEFKIPTGKYVGNLVIDGVFYPVEDITVKHYTFEVDLYLKDDIIEDEVDKTGISKAEKFLEEKQNGADITDNTDSRARYTDSRARMNEDQDHQAHSSIHVSSKYEDLVRSQMSQTKNALNDDVEPVSENVNAFFDQLDSSLLDGRRSPVGDDGGKQYEDGGAVIKDRAHVYHMNGDTTFRKEPVSDSTLQEDIDWKGRQSNSPSSGGQAAQAVVDDVLGNGHARTPVYSTETPVYSRNGSAHSSLRQTPVVSETQDYTREAVRSDSVEKRLIDSLIDESLNRTKSPTPLLGSRSGSERATPQPEQIEDVLNPADRHSPIRRDYLTGSPRVSDHGSQKGSEHGSAQGSIHGSLRGSEHGSASGSAHSSLRQTPQRDIITDSLRASQEKLYSGQDFRRSTERLNGSLSGGSSLGSRPQSLSSEQELTQYYELTSGGSGVAGSHGLPLVATGNGGPVQRTGSASSLPAVGSQRQLLEKRSMTPDNHIRVPMTGPIIKPSMLPTRGMQRTPSSATSSRTVTPVNSVTDNQEITQLQERIMDLENTVSNIRTLLASREKEVFELKANLQDVKEVNRSLHEELDQRRARTSPGLQIAELERQYREVVDEREALSAEVLRLRDEIMQNEEERTSLNSYDPNGPQALQRKIADLNSQIQDLQEANEAAVDEIKAAENKVKQLAGDNETLRATQASNMRDLEDENRHLKLEIARLKEQTSHTEVSDYRLKIEFQQVKEDNRGLRERNYQLHDDNLKLKEELDALRKSLESVESNRKSFTDDRHGARSLEKYKTHEPKLKPLDGSYHSERADKSNDRDYKTSERDYKTSDRDYKVSDRKYISSDRDYKSSERDYRTSDREYKTSEYLSELKRDVDREKEREKHVYSYTTPGYDSRSKYDLKQERIRGEKNEEEKYASLEISASYSSYRTVPDGRTSEKSPTRSQYETRTLSPERSVLAKGDYYRSANSLDRPRPNDGLVSQELTRTRRERSRTSSAELDFRSVPLSAYSELSKTMPSLSGRSRAIYKSLSSLRARIRSKSPRNSHSNPPGSRASQFCESTAYFDDSQKYSETLSMSSKSYLRPHCSNDETRLRIAPDLNSTSYSKGGLLSGVSRKHEETISREEKGLNPRPSAQYQDDEDVSDTATDILVNAKPLENLPTASSSWNRSRPRRGSVGSEGSNSSFDDIDEQLTAAARKRSKSADGREILRRMAPAVTLSGSGPTTPVKGERTSNAGFRSVTPQPLATQRNKPSSAIPPVTMSLTHGLRPFAPRSAADLQLSDVIKFSRQGGKLSQGTIKFIGHLPGRGDIYLGVELDKEDGKHDGTFEGIRYFKCKPNKGVFVAYNKVVMAWTA